MAHIFDRLQERHAVLSHIAHALRDVREKDPQKDVPITWEYGKPTRQETPEQTIIRFMERSVDYKATVVRLEREEQLPAAVASAVSDLGLKSLVVPPELDARWLTSLDENTVTLLQDKPPLSKEALDTIDGVLTASAVAIAETGTIALDHSANQGRRIISLLPSCHLCVVQAQDIVDGVPEAMQRLKPAFTTGNPLTWISGPSATVDIEFSRVEGVHGPHKLYVFVVG